MTRAEGIAAALLALAAAYVAFDATRIGADPADQTGIAPTLARTARPARRDTHAAEAIVTRALFTPSRRGDFAPEDSEGTIGGYVLRGTLSGVAGQFAMFEPLRGGPARRLRPGNAIGGYTLVAIGAESVLLARDGERRRIDIGDAPVVPAPEPRGADAPASPSLPSPPPPGDEEPLPIITVRDVEAE